MVGRVGDDVETVVPGAHAYDGSYTCLTLTWRDTTWKIETAVDRDDWVALVTPLEKQFKPAALIVETAILWNRPGSLRRAGEVLVAETPGGAISVHATGAHVEDTWPGEGTPYLLIPVADPVGVATGSPRSLAAIEAIVRARRDAHQDRARPEGELREVYDALQSCMAWDTIYDPGKDRVVSPVSRNWSCTTGGYSLFCWDNYFAASEGVARTRPCA